MTDWDPVSKQPLFKTAAASLSLVERGGGAQSPAPTVGASAPAGPGAKAVAVTSGGPRAHASQSTGGQAAGHEPAPSQGGPE